MPSSNPLPPKENSLYKRILKCYEHKQYKNGLKFAKQILSNPKFAEHGETLAMKGLTLNCLGRKDEAYEHVRRGLRNDLKSHVCWHVYGLLQRSDRKYDEAIKCYRNALKWEKDNIQILRDLSLLQIQMRDLEGYRDTCYQLFMLRPTQRASWISFAMAYHLLKDYETALKILDSFRKTLVPGVYDYEHSELLLYQNMVIQESGDLKEALNHLSECQKQICDKVTVQETLANLYLSLNKNQEAEKIIRELLCRNPENTLYYSLLNKALDINEDENKLNLLLDLVKAEPKALVPKRLILDYASADNFIQEVDNYLRKGLRKGVPPLFVDLRCLYKDPVKASVIENLVLSYVESLRLYGVFSTKGNNGIKEPPSVLLWTYYFLAQHYDHLRNTQKALEYISYAIEHTPTLIELLITKARIYKHAGDVYEAYRWVDEAQSLDTADRYINSKCAKYMLRANLIKEAEEICSKFTREGVPAMENLNEMQCMWFQTECALAYKRLENWGESLKKCHEVDRHFSEIVEDQFDFHTYCMRKMTLRSYVGLLRLEDVLRAHKFYQKAAFCAISVYLRLHDHPIQDEKREEQIKLETMDPSELKKSRNKQRKAQKRAEQQQAEAIAAAEKREQYNKSRQIADQENDSVHQEELIPDKLARVPDPLEQATKFLIPLQYLSSKNVETHLMAYEIYSRKEKPLLMLQSIKRAYRVNSEHHLVHEALVRFSQKMEQWKSHGNLPQPVSKVIENEMEPILKGRSPLKINDEFLAKWKNHLPSLLQGARVMYMLDGTRQKEALELATGTETGLEDVSIQTCCDVLMSLKKGDLGNCEEYVNEYKRKCHSLFPYALDFLPPGIKKTIALNKYLESSDSEEK